MTTPQNYGSYPCELRMNDITQPLAVAYHGARDRKARVRPRALLSTVSFFSKWNDVCWVPDISAP
jgi:hypothetical protein